MASMFPNDRSTTPAPGGLVDRAKRLLLDPKAEWPRIDAEPMSAQGVFRSWAVPLAAIGPVAGLIGQQAFGYGAFGVSYRPSLGFSVVTAALTYGLALAGVWVLALVIDALAPNFGGRQSRDQAMKVAAFGSTAAWLAGVFQLVPMLGVLGLAGLYSLYLLWLGLPQLMRVAPERATGYFVGVLLTALVVNLVGGALATSIAGRIVSPMSVTADGGTVSVAGLGTIDTGKMQAMADRANAAAEKIKAQAESGKPAEVTPVATLQAMLPQMSGWTRGDVETQSGGAGGIGGSSASARYTMGDQSMTVTVADIGAMGALAGLGAAMNIQSSKQTADGYEKVDTQGGRVVTAKWNGADKSGSYSVVVGNRFTVSAEGSAPSDAAFKAAVDGVDLGKLEAMAK